LTDDTEEEEVAEDEEERGVSTDTVRFCGRRKWVYEISDVALSEVAEEEEDGGREVVEEEEERSWRAER